MRAGLVIINASVLARQLWRVIGDDKEKRLPVPKFKAGVVKREESNRGDAGSARLRRQIKLHKSIFKQHRWRD